jgi:hypothetical protein
MPKVIDLTAVRRQLSDCLGIYPRITAELQRRWESGTITTEELAEILSGLGALSEMPISRPFDSGPGSIEYALRDRHHNCTSTREA